MNTILSETLFEELENLKKAYAEFEYCWSSKLLPPDPEYVAHIEKKYGKAWAEKVSPSREKSYTRLAPVPLVRISEFEDKWNMVIPGTIKDFFLNYGEVHFDVSFVAYSYSKANRPSGIALGPEHIANHAQLDISLAEMDRAEQSRRTCLEHGFHNDEYERPWRNTIGFMLADNGDIIAVDPQTEKVVYLSCDGDTKSNGTVLGNTVNDYIDRLVRVGLLGKKFHELKSFFTEGKEGIDADCLAAAMFRYKIGLEPRPVDASQCEEREWSGPKSVALSNEPVLFKKWILSQIKDNLGPVFRVNGYKKGRTNWFIRERNGVIQYVRFVVLQGEVTIWGGSTPVYLPYLSLPYDEFRLPPNKKWIQWNGGVNGYLVPKSALVYIVTPQVAAKWDEAEKIVREAILPQLDLIKNLHDLMKVAPGNSWTGVKPYVEGVYECLFSDFSSGMDKLRLSQSQMKDFKLREGNSLSVLREHIALFCNGVSGDNCNMEAFLQIYNQICAEWRKWYKLPQAKAAQ